jgi:hypothetical protein
MTIRFEYDPMTLLRFAFEEGDVPLADAILRILRRDAGLRKRADLELRSLQRVQLPRQRSASAQRVLRKVFRSLGLNGPRD